MSLSPLLPTVIRLVLTLGLRAQTQSIFGYMVFLIFFKWSYEFSAPQDAPNLLNLMISMFLKPFKLQPIDDLFPGQLYLQWVLIAVCAISVPMMLLPKPLLLRRDHKRGYKRYAPPFSLPPSSSFCLLLRKRTRDDSINHLMQKGDQKLLTRDF